MSTLTLDRIERACRNHRPAPAGGVAGRPGAVLVPFCMVHGEVHLLLIRRSMEVPFHKGEMAFPGGGVEPADADSAAAAVRETVEELGVREGEIETWAPLDTLATISGYALTPYTGRLARTNGLEPSRNEVAEVITVPVAELRAGALDRDETRVDDGVWESRPTYAYNGRVIWGATGRIVAQTIELLRHI